MFNATFNNSVISWWSVLLVQKTGIPGENHRPVPSHRERLSHKVVPSTSRHERNSNTTISTKRIITTKGIFEFVFSKILRLRVMCLTLLSTINISVWYRDGQLYRCMTHEYSDKTNKAQVNDGNRTHSLSSDIVTYFLLHSKQIYTNIYIIFQEYIELLKAISLAFLLYSYHTYKQGAVVVMTVW